MYQDYYGLISYLSLVVVTRDQTIDCRLQRLSHVVLSVSRMVVETCGVLTDQQFNAATYM